MEFSLYMFLALVAMCVIISFLFRVIKLAVIIVVVLGLLYGFGNVFDGLNDVKGFMTGWSVAEQRVGEKVIDAPISISGFVEEHAGMPQPEESTILSEKQDNVS